MTPKTKSDNPPRPREKTPAAPLPAGTAATPGDAAPPAASWGEWMNLRTNLAWVMEGAVSPEFRKGHYNADHLGAWLILDGACTLRQPGKTVTARAGDWLVPWPGSRHQEFTPDARILSVRFNAHWPDGKPLFEHGLSAVFRASDHPLLEKKARALLRAAQRVIPDNRDHVSTATIPFEAFFDVKVALLHWVNEFWRTLCAIGLRPTRVGIRDERIVRTLQRLDVLPLSSRPLERHLAQACGLGVSQFVRVFRERLGETPKQYFERRRHGYCRQMLANSNVPIKEIACTLGFTRLSDFSAWVKGRLGLPPRRFRETAATGRAV
ncbi:MAG: AraC family transcriptional regulator [Opitutaceae bacterium]|nr:AraC family transcriptional regulator [Opitutaceae bacterium]